MLQDDPRFQLALDYVSTWEPAPCPPDWQPEPIPWNSPQARSAHAALMRRHLERATAHVDFTPYLDMLDRPRKWFRTGGH